MIRLHIVAEGQTEEGFVNNVLKQHLAQFDVFADVRCIETSRRRWNRQIFRGGFLSYEMLKNDLLLWMKQDTHPEVRFTTMVDVYALPSDFPGFEAIGMAKDPISLIARLESLMAEDIDSSRLIPYLQLHEFEALLLAEPSHLSTFFIEHDQAIRRLTEMAQSYASPELINQGKQTAPSKRIIAEIPEYEYQKTSVGPAIAEKIGLPVLRQKCPHFDKWVTLLETLKS
jgi:hypothetical protein